VQNQRNYLLSLDISTNQEKQQSSTLHIGTHILSENSKDNAQSPNQTGIIAHINVQIQTISKAFRVRAYPSSKPRS
jgi:insecticidal toxin complex protein TccC